MPFLIFSLVFLFSCASTPPKTSANLISEFKKICVEGTGKGRIELLTTKHTFTYESEINRKDQAFHLVLDFPIVGERELIISLNPAIANQMIKNSELSNYLNEQLGEREDKKRIAKGIEDFFVFASDFMRFKAIKTYPQHYAASFANDHYLLERNTPSYRFVVDSFSPNDKFFERVVFKIFIKGLSSNAILTLFLVPQSCDM